MKEDESTQLYFLVEDWIEQDPILKQHFHMWPEIAQSARYKGHQVATRWILAGARNVSFISTEGVWLMQPVVSDKEQIQSPWVKLNHADPHFFDQLREYLMCFIQ